MMNLVILILLHLTNWLNKYCWSKFEKKVNGVIYLRTEVVLCRNVQGFFQRMDGELNFKFPQMWSTFHNLIEFHLFHIKTSKMLSKLSDKQIMLIDVKKSIKNDKID